MNSSLNQADQIPQQNNPGLNRAIIITISFFATILLGLALLPYWFAYRLLNGWYGVGYTNWGWVIVFVYTWVILCTLLTKYNNMIEKAKRKEQDNNL